MHIRIEYRLAMASALLFLSGIGLFLMGQQVHQDDSLRALRAGTTVSTDWSSLAQIAVALLVLGVVCMLATFWTFMRAEPEPALR